MKPFYYFTAICATSLMLLTSACSDGDNTETKVIKKFPDVEAVAKQHAQEFTQSPASGKSTQKKLFSTPTMPRIIDKKYKKGIDK